MRLYIRYFAIIACALATISCALDEFDHSPVRNVNSDAVTVIGRITRFDEYDVATRSVKNENESKLTSMAMAIFPVNEDGTSLAGNCVYWQYTENQAELLFTIDRGSNYTYNARYAMYVFTNMDMSDFGIGSTLDDMLAKFHEVKNIDIPENGFPMIGSLGDTFSTSFDKDDQVFILSPIDANGDLVAPRVNGTTQTLLTIPMKAMFAKINFTIEVRPDQQIDGNYSSQFTLGSYTVNNVPSTVDFKNNTNSDTEVLSKTFTVNTEAVASGANKINFSFYLPERMLKPSTTWENYNYPFEKGTYSTQIDKDQNGYRDEDEKYMQRFKPNLVGKEQKATNVVISGRFRDHQNHYWNIDYTIYLGADNYGDFNILRNSEYNNIITIRGIQSSNDMSDVENAISIDHRVDVERTQPAIISLRREVLLDSHFEVRPLRVRNSGIDNIGKINAVKVEVVNPTTTNWMRLERSAGVGTAYAEMKNASGESIYIGSEGGASEGKRRYFTYNLVDGKTPGTYDYPLNNSTEVILPLTDDGDCCWIYVDECTEVGDGIRAGIVRVTYGTLSESNFTPTDNINFPPVNYIINQRKLFEVKYDDPETTADENRRYHIEYEEEYLHNYDADDSYGETVYEGMPWGLDSIHLSYDNKALYFGNQSQSWLTGIFNAIVNWVASSTGINPMYDFYIPKHDTKVSTLATKRAFRGYVFCNEIIQTVNGYGNHDTDASNNVDILQLDEQPKSAIEYCYNKNKRNNIGEVVWQNTNNTYNQSQLNWYLPAVDEIEDIVMSEYGNGLKTYARFLEFQEKFYWSSQPSFIRNFARYEITGQNGEFYYDDTSHARATSVSYDSATQKFDYSRSGSTSYYGALRIFAGPGLFGALNPEYEILYSGSYQNHSLGTIVREPGNKARNSYARVRCVRKSEYTNTSAE